MIRPYDSATDALWPLKRAFETGLGESGGEAKAEAYDAKLTDDYRERWLDWVARCASGDDGCVQVAERDGDLVGYAFLLPESLCFVWDAAVLNEIYVEPAFRGTGVADDLMDAVLAVAGGQDLPLDRIVLDVDRENERAQAFYERYGFEHWGELVARDC